MSSTFEKSLININFTPEENVRLVTSVITLIGYQIPSHSFRDAAKQPDSGGQSADLDRFLEQLLMSLLEIQSRARAYIRTAKPGDDGHGWPELLKRTCLAVTEILGQMTWSSFVAIMLGILKESSGGLMKTALEELGGTLTLRSAITKHDAPHLVPLIDAMVAILKQPVPLTTEGAGVQRGCLFCLKQLAGILGAHSSDTWPTIMSASAAFLTSSDVAIRCEAISCLTTIISTVKTGVLPRLPEFLPVLLEHIHQIISGSASQDTLALLAALEALEVIVTVLTAFISPQLAKILSIVAGCVEKSVKTGVKDVFAGRLLKVRTVLCGEVPFRVMFIAFKEAYGALRQTEAFNIFNDSLKKAKTGEIFALQREIVDFLFTVFETRDDLPAALDALSLVALRMPESNFKGLFMKLYQWATHDGINRNKLLTFYQIVDRLTDALKHLFTIYAATVVSHAVSVMGSFHVTQNKKAASRGERESDVEIETEILTTAFDVLSKFFKYDSAGYFNADQCDLLSQPLVDQLDNYRDPASFGRLIDHLVPAITGFTACLNDDTLWKPLHYQVLLKSRHDEPRVRVAALQTVEALVESMGDAYTNLLPEAVTFLVELSAEDEEMVEVQCARTKATIEKVLGSSTIWRNEIE